MPSLSTNDNILEKVYSTNKYDLYISKTQSIFYISYLFLGSLMAKITILKDNGKTAPIVLFCIIISRFQTRKDVSTYIFFFLIRL